MSLHNLFDALKNSNEIEFPQGWAQGRAGFGGLVGALLYARLAAVVKADCVLRSATVSFVGPVAAGPITVTAEVLRQGKSVIQAEARIIQNGEVLAVMLASFGVARSSYIAVPAATAPAFSAPDSSPVLPYFPSISPEFMQHFDIRWAHGDFPFTGSTLPELGGWMRAKESRGAFDLIDLFLLGDAWPPAVLPMVKGMAPGSSLSWTLEPVWLPANKTSADWWQYQSKADCAADGYSNTQARVWDSEGRLVAISRQTVVVFA